MYTVLLQIFVAQYFMINLDIIKICSQNLKFKCKFRMQTEDVYRKLVIGYVPGIAILVLHNHTSCH